MKNNGDTHLDYVTNLMEQTQDTDHLSLPQTTNFTLTQLFPTANNTIQQTQMRLLIRHPYGSAILQAMQTYALK